MPDFFAKLLSNGINDSDVVPSDHARLLVPEGSPDHAVPLWQPLAAEVDQHEARLLVLVLRPCPSCRHAQPAPQSEPLTLHARQSACPQHAAESAARRGDFAEAEKLQALANNKRSEATPIKRLYNDVYEALRTAKCMLQTAMVNKQVSAAAARLHAVRASPVCIARSLSSFTPTTSICCDVRLSDCQCSGHRPASGTGR